MKAERFEDLIVWQSAKDLAVAIYTSFESCRDFGFRDQIQRASVSIMNFQNAFKLHKETVKAY